MAKAKPRKKRASNGWQHVAPADPAKSTNAYIKELPPGLFGNVVIAVEMRGQPDVYNMVTLSREQLLKLADLIGAK